MAGFKQGGIEFKQKSVIGNPTTSEHIIVYWNNTSDLVVKSSSGEEILATESLIASISGVLQSQIDNLDLNYATDAQLASISGVLQSQITSNDLQIAGLVSISGNHETRLDDLESQIITVSGDSGKVKVSADDTTSDYLINKLTVNEGITITEKLSGGNENLEIELGKAYQANATSGLFEGGTLSAGISAGTIDIASGQGYYTDHTDIDNIDEHNL
jgi:hypothetical protein